MVKPDCADKVVGYLYTPLATHLVEAVRLYQVYRKQLSEALQGACRQDSSSRECIYQQERLLSLAEKNLIAFKLQWELLLLSIDKKQLTEEDLGLYTKTQQSLAQYLNTKQGDV